MTDLDKAMAFYTGKLGSTAAILDDTCGNQIMIYQENTKALELYKEGTPARVEDIQAEPGLAGVLGDLGVEGFHAGT